MLFQCEIVKQIFGESFPVALMKASLEILEGEYSAEELKKQTDRKIVIHNALEFVTDN